MVPTEPRDVTPWAIEAEYHRVLQLGGPRRVLQPVSGLIDQNTLTTTEKLRLFIDGFDAVLVCAVCRRALVGHIHVECDQFLEAKRCIPSVPRGPSSSQS